MTRIAWWLRIPAALPWGALYRVSAVLAWLLHRVVRLRVAVMRENLRSCFPDLDAAALDKLIARHYFEITSAGLEMFKLATMDAAELRERVRLLNPEVLDAEIRAGRNVMGLNAHQGNWEWLLQRMAVDYGPVVCAYKPLRSARFDRDLHALRSRFGVQMVPAKSLLRTLLRTPDPHYIGLLADQMPSSSPSRVWLPFMGRITAFYPGPAEIAARYGYTALFLAMHRVANGRYEVEFRFIAAADEKVDVSEFTRRYVACVEEQLRRAPWDWIWGHRRWKLAPPAGA